MKNASSQKLPKNVKEAVKRIVNRLPPQDKRVLKSMPQKDMIKFHHGFGTTIRNAFGLWHGNPALLKDCDRVQKKQYPEDYKKCQKLYSTYNEKMESPIHPDDASGVILNEVWKVCQK